MIDRAPIENRLAGLAELETQLSDPKTAADQKLFRRLVRDHAALTRLAKRSEGYFALLDSVEENRALMAEENGDPDLKELAEMELEGTDERLDKAEKKLLFALLPPDPNADRNAIVEVRAGTGGEEASLFAGDLFRLYSRYAEAKGWKIGIIDASTSEIGGYKEVVFQVGGKGAYGALQFESGGHRVQRVPVTESSGRIHTSAATVAVFPEADEEDDISIPADDIRIDIYCASGPGGQCVNTTYSAVRITHFPTGVVVQCQDERSQHRNKEKAMGVLKARILDHMRQEEAARMGDERRNLIGSGDRSQRVRTYNFPQNRVTDHRVNLTLYSLDRVMEGALDELVAALQDHDVALRLKHELS